MLKKFFLCMIFALICFTAVAPGAEYPVAKAVLEDKIKIINFKNSLPPVAKAILFDSPKENMDMLVSERGEETVVRESDWDDLPVVEATDDDITEFFDQFVDEKSLPEIVTPKDGDLLPDNYNIHIRINYEGSEPCYAVINSLNSHSVLEIQNKELVILSSKLVRGREYHLRVRAGCGYSETVSFRVGSKYEDEIERIIANTDVVAIGPRIDMSEIFPNGIFHSEEEADAGMTTITVKVWRANTTDVEVDEEQIVDEVVKTVRVPVTRFMGGDDADEDDLMERSVGDGENEEQDEETDEVEIDEDIEENGDEAEADEPKTPEESSAEEPKEEKTEESKEPDETEVSEETAESETEVSNDETGDEPASENKKKPEYVTVEEYTEITTIEYVTKTVKRKVKQGELYSSTMSITVNRALADSFVAIFDELYEIRFPIESAGCYNWRNTVSGRISEHALGTAIDINPDQNYCIYGDGSTVGEYWRPYEDIYSVTPEVVNIFRKYNFSWGGSWVTPKDYMHFSYFGT